LQCLSVAVRIEEGHLLELRHSDFVGTGARADMEVIERIVMEEENHHSVVTKNMIIKKHDIPWVLAPLIWFVSHFGKPVGEDKLKLMCESSP